MKLALVALPWAPYNLPSAALGALAGFLKLHEPEIEVECRSEFVTVWRRLGAYYGLLSRLGPVGELVYAALVHEEARDLVVGHVLTAFESHDRRAELRGEQRFGRPVDRQNLDRLLGVLAQHLDETAETLARTADVVGLTTSFGQLFASLALAKRIKRGAPEVMIVLGGTGSRGAPLGLMRQYGFVDFVIRGEGELRLGALLGALRQGESLTGLGPGVYWRGQVDSSASDLDPSDRPSPLSLGPDRLDLREQPLPDFDEYATRAEEHQILWTLPFEGARGCWWDRTERTGNPLQACYFCGSSGSRTYRRKPDGQIQAELAQLVERYELTRVLFLDSMVPHQGGLGLADALKRGVPDYRFTTEIRASISSLELVELVEAGCFAVQIGVESLSSSYLRRINKGTSVIRNLATMRTCFELDLESGSNLLIGFPGETQAEVEETRENILRFAIAFNPLLIARFKLDIDSAVFLRPERFGVSRVRNHELFRGVLPDSVLEGICLPLLEIDCENEPADWSSVEQACLEWRRLHERLRAAGDFAEIRKPLFYTDGGSFLEIIDRRDGLRTITLDPILRRIYLECTEIRSARQLLASLGSTCSENELLDEILPALVEENLMFCEKGRYLSLAVASRREIAARRIRETAARSQAGAARVRLATA